MVKNRMETIRVRYVSGEYGFITVFTTTQEANRILDYLRKKQNE